MKFINKYGVIPDITEHNNERYNAERIYSLEDNLSLVKKYILEIWGKDSVGIQGAEAKFITEITFDEIPTQEVMMFHMLDNNVNRYGGYCTIQETFEIDYQN